MHRQANRENAKVRVIAVYRMLLRGKLMTSTQILSELQAHYGITADRKTIYDDVAAIDRIRPIKVIPGKRGGFILWDVMGEAKD